MQRLSSINTQLSYQSTPPTNQNHLISALIKQKRNRLILALDPHLTDITKHLIQQEYSFILPKVQEGRKLIKEFDKKMRKDQEMEVHQKIALITYRKHLQDTLYEVFPKLLNEISNHLKTKIDIKHDNNYIMKAINLYSSIMGSYQLKLTLLDKLTPNLKTLSDIQWQNTQQLHENDLGRKFRLALYVFFFAYVMIFKQYITNLQKNELIQLIKVRFIDSLAVLVGNLYEVEERTTRLEEDHKIQEWIEEIHKNKKMSAL